MTNPEQIESLAHVGASLFSSLAADLTRLAEFSGSTATPEELQSIVLGNAGLDAFLELVRGLAPVDQPEAIAAE